MKGRFLVIRGGAIGDFILTLPVLAALQKSFPESEVHLLAYPHVASLATAAGLSHQVHSIESRPLAGFFARNGNLDSGLAESFAHYAVIVSYLYDPDQIFQSNVARVSRAQFIAGPFRPDETAGVPASQALLKPLEKLCVFDADPEPRLAFPRAENPPAPGAIAFHPGSGSDTKNWPESHWQKWLEKMVTRSPRPLLMVGGEAEGEKLDRLARGLPADRLQIARSLPLVDLARKLTHCHGFIGHDSGITHLAAAVGLPALALWGPSNEQVWRPPSPRLSVLKHPQGLEKLPVDEVVEATLKKFS